MKAQWEININSVTIRIRDQSEIFYLSSFIMFILTSYIQNIFCKCDWFKICCQQ